MSARLASVCAIAALVAATSGCDDPSSSEEMVEIGIGATLAVEMVDGGVHVTGEVVIDLAVPPGDEGTDLVLMEVQVGAFSLMAADLGGLDGFPDRLEAGEKARVVLTVDRAPIPGEVGDSTSACGDAADAPWDVSAQVLDVRAAEASEYAGYAVATTQVEPAMAGVGPPPLIATTLWAGPDGSVLAADPEGGDDVLVVTPSGSTERVAADGQVMAAGHLGIAPLAVARGGGVDVVVGTLVDAVDSRCGATDSPAFVARIEDGELAWCRPMSSGIVTVDRTGVTTVVDAGVETALALRRLDPDGATLDTTPLDAPIFRLVAAPDGRVVGLSAGADGVPVLLVFDGSATRSLVVEDIFFELGVRHDGAIAVRTFSTWAELDLDAMALVPVAQFDPSADLLNAATTELEEGVLLALTGARFLVPDGTYGTAFELSMHEAGTVSWRRAIACTGYQASILPTIGPRRYAVARSWASGDPIELLKFERAP